MNLSFTPSILETVCQTSASEVKLISQLASYHLIPQLLCETLVDQAIAPISCTAEETTAACEQLYQHWGLASPEQQQAWRSHYNLTSEQVEHIATRQQRIEMFKQLTWGHKLKSYFLQRKQDLDQVIYSLLRTHERDLAQELYFRILEGEQSFTDLVYQYSEGEETKTGGLAGPIELGALNTKLAGLLHHSQIGEVQTLVLGDWCLIVRLEKRLPAQLDEPMQKRLLQERFEEWLRSQVQALNEFDQRWFGITPEQQTSL